ncbi:MAG TPA: hypothetical protein VMP00_00500 [Burkholderiales bacterium]|nr:hypothetical protein [Burkholderiales bacterium]
MQVSSAAYAGATGNGTAKCSELKPGANGVAISEVTGYVDLKR